MLVLHIWVISEERKRGKKREKERRRYKGRRREKRREMERKREKRREKERKEEKRREKCPGSIIINLHSVLKEKN